MLLYICDRCKFTTPGSEQLCQTCGARFKKDEAVKEVLYRINEKESQGIGAAISKGIDALGELISGTLESLHSNKLPEELKETST